MARHRHPLCDVSITPKPYKSIRFIQFSSLSMKNHIFFLQSLCFINSSGHSKSHKGSRNHQAENGFLWKYVERERALNGGDTLSSRPLIDGSLSTEFLWQSKSHRGAHWRTHRAERQNTRIHAKILEKGSSENYLGGEPRTRLINVLDSHRKLQSLWEVRQKHILTKLVVLFSTNDNYSLTILSNPILSLKGFLWILTLSIFWDPLIARCQKWIRCIYCANVKLSNNIWHCHKYKSIYYSILLNSEYL